MAIIFITSFQWDDPGIDVAVQRPYQVLLGRVCLPEIPLAMKFPVLRQFFQLFKTNWRCSGVTLSREQLKACEVFTQNIQLFVSLQLLQQILCVSGILGQSMAHDKSRATVYPTSLAQLFFSKKLCCTCSIAVRFAEILDANLAFPILRESPWDEALLGLLRLPVTNFTPWH